MRIQILHIRRHVDIEKPQCDVFERLHLVLSRSRLSGVGSRMLEESVVDGK
jgi:hypothetical protein